MAKNFRLYIDQPLALGSTFTLNKNQVHYLKDVVKYTSSDSILCFDNQNGEFLCEIATQSNKELTLLVIKKTKPYTKCPDIWLLFAPLKKDCTDFVIEKATELGISCIIPIITQHTNTTNIKTERYLAQAIEAAEQCHRTDLPKICSKQSLLSVLNNWDKERTLFFMDETLQSKSFYETLQTNNLKKAAILIGPEGGFSISELELLRNKPYAVGATLGPRILRAETAALAALSCWQMLCGDWNNYEHTDC